MEARKFLSRPGEILTVLIISCAVYFGLSWLLHALDLTSFH